MVLGIALRIIVWIGTFVLDTTLVMIYFVLELCLAELHQMMILMITKHMKTVVHQLRLSSRVDR